MCRLPVVLLVCFSLSALSVYGRVSMDNIIFPGSLDTRYQNHPWSLNDNFGVGSMNARPTRQNNRRTTTRRPQTTPVEEEEDPFSGLDSDGVSGNGNRPFGGNDQWSNNGNAGGQRPNQQQQGNSQRPQGSNQWGNNGGGGSGQGFPGNNGGGPGQGFPGNNGGGLGQGLSGNNGGGPGQGFPGNNGGGNRPTNQNQNQNQQQTSTESNNEALRQPCNEQCKMTTTYEYNPVCGSDSQVYQNRRFLDCMSQCGLLVQFSYTGSCVRPAASN